MGEMNARTRCLSKIYGAKIDVAAKPNNMQRKLDCTNDTNTVIGRLY